MYEVKRTSKFRREYRKMLKRGYDSTLFDEVVFMLATGESLASKYRDHALSGKWSGYRECHITPDWLLIYAIRESVLVLVLAGTGTHSDLF